LRRYVSVLAVLAFWLAAGVRGARAQGVRGWVGTTVQMVELRPIAVDTIARDRVARGTDGRLRYNGGVVTCVSDDVCLGYRLRGEEATMAATQDVGFTAWGFGVGGLSFTALLRARTRLGSDLAWPRTDDRFDAMLAYGQWNRGRVRVRVGRQEIRSGLGFPAFDGGSAALTVAGFRVEGYGGRSLARGLRDPANEALRGLEDFVVDRSVYLFGGSARFRAGATGVTARYQREIYSDRSGLVAERGSIDLASVLPRTRVSGSLDYDFGLGRVGKGHLTLAVPLLDGKLLVEASARRYLPYFQLSTIWGFFEPVAYTEGELRAAWSPSSAVGLWLSGGWRHYGDAGTAVVLEPLENTGRRVSAGARWLPDPAWGVDGSYRLEWGPGGFLSSGDAAVRWMPSEDLTLSARAMSFQQIEQFRLGDGRAYGGGVSADARLTDRIRFSGGLTVIRQTASGGAVDSPWNQTRGWSALRIEVGQDPGLANRRSR